MNLPVTLRTETEALCLEIERFEQQVTSGEVALDGAQRRWESVYQPQALALAKALLSRVPSGDPRVMTRSRVGNSRVLTADILTGIENALPDELEVASAHLGFVAEQLRQLIDYLSPESEER